MYHARLRDRLPTAIHNTLAERLDCYRVLRCSAFALLRTLGHSPIRCASATVRMTAGFYDPNLLFDFILAYCQLVAAIRAHDDIVFRRVT